MRNKMLKVKLLKLVTAVALAFSLSSCAVYMAAQKKGTSPEVLAQCKTRTCLINQGAVVISQKANKSGNLSEEIFQVQKPTGSAARAIMHGTLDVATLGLWEVAGTPVEGVLNKPDRYGVKVSYKENSETIKSIQLIEK